MAKKFIFKIIICFSLVISLFITGVTSYATNAGLEEAEKRKEEIQNSIDEANALISELNSSLASSREKLTRINASIAALESESLDLEARAAGVEEEISSLLLVIAHNREEVSLKKEQMAKRIVFSYENGRTSLINAIFSSKSLGEFFNILEYSYEMARYDKLCLDEFAKILTELEAEEQSLYDKRKEAAALIEENENKQAAAALLKKEAELALSELDEELTDAKEIAAVYEKEMAAQNEVLEAIREEIRRQEEEERRRREAIARGEDPDALPPSYAFGFIWPCPASHRITSDYGLRESPTQGASTNHKGVDIGAKTGSEILAVQSGTVILSKYSQSAGNYIIINHGKNAEGKTVCSVYMHANERFVEVGDKVSLGDVIAAVGSTGYSTGPHLHFGVTEDGAYVDPKNYLSY